MDRSSIAVLAVAALAVCASINSYSISKHLAGQLPDRYGIAAAERRFAGALQVLPPGGVVGYITDMPLSENVGPVAFMSAQYALAPHPLVPVEKAQADWAIGNFAHPGDFGARGAQAGFAMVEDLGDGAVVYRRAPR